MIKIGVLGDIGSGKSYVANSFGYPVFNADKEVSKLYNTDKKIFQKLKKILPNFFQKFPIEKNQISNAILDKEQNLKKIVKTHVIDILDHSQFDVEVSWFKNRQPSSENLVKYIWHQIEPRLKDAKLYRIRLHETPTIFTDYYGK